MEYCIELAEKKGFKAYEAGMKLSAGDKVYFNNRGKGIMLAVIGSEDLSHGANIGAAHTDSPRLDLKPRPLYEEAEMAYFKTHHYGGIRKYQWVTIPLGAARRGRAARRFEGRRPHRRPRRTIPSSSSTTFYRTLAASRAKSRSTRPSRARA